MSWCHVLGPSHKGSWTHNPDLVDILCALILILIIQSVHKFAQVMTALLSWHVQNCGLIGSLWVTLKLRIFSQDLDYGLINGMWNGPLAFPGWNCHDCLLVCGQSHLLDITLHLILLMQHWLLTRWVIWGSLNMCLYFLSFLNTVTVWSFEICPHHAHERQRHVYFAESVPCLLIAWCRKEPGHHQLWCWLTSLKIFLNQHQKS